MKISILMLTYNAPKYVYQTIRSLQLTKSAVPYELIVVDNCSRWPTRRLVQSFYEKGMIDKLKLNQTNALFAKGNNIASTLTAADTTHYLLLNSDIQIKSPDWLDKLVSIFPENGGVSAFGAVMSEPIRADGYCMMIDKSLYDKYKLDEEFEWWWSITKLQAQLLSEGYEIKAVKNHEALIHHYGGKSGKGFKDAKGMDIHIEEVKKWFSKENCVKIMEQI